MDEKKVCINIYISQELKEQLQNEAKEKNISLSSYIKMLIANRNENK